MSFIFGGVDLEALPGVTLNVSEYMNQGGLALDLVDTPGTDGRFYGGSRRAVTQIPFNVTILGSTQVEADARRLEFIRAIDPSRGPQSLRLDAYPEWHYERTTLAGEIAWEKTADRSKVAYQGSAVFETVGDPAMRRVNPELSEATGTLEYTYGIGSTTCYPTLAIRDSSGGDFTVRVGDFELELTDVPAGGLPYLSWDDFTFYTREFDVQYEVEHLWTGNRHASASVKEVYGFENARNHVWNPRFENGLGSWSVAAVIRDDVTVVGPDEVFYGKNYAPDPNFTEDGIWNDEALYWVGQGDGVLEARGIYGDYGVYSYSIPEHIIPIRYNETVEISCKYNIISGHSYLPIQLVIYEVNSAGTIMAEHLPSTVGANLHTIRFTASTPNVYGIRVGFRSPRRTYSTRTAISDLRVTRQISETDNMIKVPVDSERTANNDIDMNKIDTAVGEWIALAGEVAQTGTNGTYQVQFRIRDSSNSWTYPYAPIYDIGERRRIIAIMQVPGDSDGGWSSLRISFRDRSSDENTFYGTRFMVAVADSEWSALDQVESFFDGDSLNSIQAVSQGTRIHSLVPSMGTYERPVLYPGQTVNISVTKNGAQVPFMFMPNARRA